MKNEWHITIELPHEHWGTKGGDKTLCGVEGPCLVRFEFYENFSKAHMLKEAGVCEKRLELFNQEEKRGEDGR